jgi:hypothetical protein
MAFACLAMFGCSSDVIVGGYDSAQPALASGSGNAVAWSIDVDSDDNVYLVGAFDGSMTIGARTETSRAGAEQSAFAASLDPRGELRWLVTEPATYFASLEYVRVLGDRVFATGIYLGMLDAPSGTIDSMFGQNLLLAIYDRGGTTLDARSFGNDRNVQGKAVDADPAGALIGLGGHYVGDVDFGSGQLATTPIDVDYGFVASFDASMNALWSRAILGDANVFVDGAVIDEAGAIYACGWFANAVELGGGMVTRGGVRDGYIAAFEPGGAERWARQLGGPGEDGAFFMTAMPNGDLVITGRTNGGDLGGGPVTSAGGADAFVARYARDGSLVAARLFGGPGDDSGEAIAALPDGSILLGMSFSDRVTIGRELVSAGGLDLAIVELDGSLEPRWVRTYGGPGDSHVGSVAAQSSGHVVFAAQFDGTIDVDGTPLSSTGARDVFVHRFARGP